MSIPAQDIVDVCRAALDAEGSDRYTFDRDFKPAINNALHWLVKVISSGLGANKFGEEVFRELTIIRVFQASAFNRIAFDPNDLGHDIWTVLAVYPVPTVHPTGSTPTSLPNPQDSKYEADVSFLHSNHSAKRLTLEEWNKNRGNPHAPGNTVLDTDCKDVLEYAYLNFANYTSNNYSISVPREIEVRPDVKNDFVAVAYAKTPTEIDQITDSVEFPDTLLNLIVNRTLIFIAYKQGDQTNLFSVSSRDVQSLIGALS